MNASEIMSYLSSLEGEIVTADAVMRVVLEIEMENIRLVLSVSEAQALGFLPAQTPYPYGWEVAG
jgi:hypothetical protein